MKRRVGLVYDLRDDYLAEGFTEEAVAEFDFPDTVDALDEALCELGYETDRIGHGRALAGRLVAGDRWDIAFSIAEGVSGRGREAQVPCLLEMYGIPYVFSDALVCAVTLDKVVAKRLVRERGLNTAPFHVVAEIADLDRMRLPFPVFAKPVAEGTGKGVDGASRCTNAPELRRVCEALMARFRQPVLVEAYLPGREFTTAVLGTGTAARVLGSMEVQLRDHAPTRDYSYDMKERCEEYVEYVALREEPLRQDVEALAIDTYRTLECRDTGRVDIRLDAEGRPAFIEINPLPGLHPHHSDLPIIATQQGMPYVEVIGAIMESACARLG